MFRIGGLVPDCVNLLWKSKYIIYCTRRVTAITFLRYAHGLPIEMLNNVQVFGSKPVNALNRMVKKSLKIQKG